MHFNTKYIFSGDSASEIKRKINYNFDQILSFAVGPNGHQGPKGSLGYDGPSGRKGASGATGLRGSLWSKSDTAPVLGNSFDLWIDSTTSNYDVSVLGATGSWSYTGYSLFSSSYFSSYDGIIGPAGITDKYAIGIKGGLTASDISLVISDDYSSISGINSNRSKLLISTNDQIDRPILTFSKTGSVSTGVPAFYWGATGSSASLRYTSTGNFELSSLLGLTIDSYTARSLLYGAQGKITSTQDINIGGTGDFYLYSNTTVGVGSNLSIKSSNIALSSSTLSSLIPIKVQPSTVTGNNQLVFDATKNTPALTSTSTAGISIVSSSTQDSAFEFFDLKNAPILSGKPRGSYSSGKHLQTIFGSTGNQVAGATGGPYLYTVKRVKEVRETTITLIASSGASLYNVMDLTSINFWDSNLIVITPTTYTSSSLLVPNPYDVYIRIPTSSEQNLEGLYNNGYGNTYRVFLNDISAIGTYKIAGLAYTYFSRNSRGVITPYQYYVKFNNSASASMSNVCYVDLTFLGVANTTNGNPRVFWKTCDGISGYITMTNRYSVGSITMTASKIVNPIGKAQGTS